MSDPEIRNVVVLVIDRLGANMLGAYGSTWFETRNFNRLAASSLVFDQALTYSPNLSETYQKLFGAITDGDANGAEAGLIERLNRLGVGSTLLTDDSLIAQQPFADDFDRVVPGQAPTDSSDPAASTDQTELANFFAQAVEAIEEAIEGQETGSCLWLHSQGLSGAWDAPLKLRNQLADSEDPEPPNFCLPPTRLFDPNTDDPDELLGYQQVCAAQVTMIDDFLGVVLDLLDDSEIGPNTMFCLMSPRGYPMGEHEIIGEFDSADYRHCHAESVHVPLMVSFPQKGQFEFLNSVRIGNLVQPDLVTDWIAKWFEANESLLPAIHQLTHALPDKNREVIAIKNGESAALQTHAWKFISGVTSDLPEGAPKFEKLFAKPDDRCEVNDVSRRCPQIIEAFSQLMEQWVEANGRFPGDLELADELASRLD